jgi:acyl-CoA dehydrogenase
MVKMKVTTQGEAVINLLWDAIAAKGFEKDMYFSQAAVDIRALPKLEGTVHVNIALIAKFMPNFFFNPEAYPDIGRQDHDRNDDFLFNQGSARGLGQIRFHDYRSAFDGIDLPNVRIFFEQTELFRKMLAQAPPGPDQMKDVDFLLAGGEIFALVVYAQLILENARVYDIGDDLLDQIFEFMVRDVSGYALQLLGQPSSNDVQIDACRGMIRKPLHDADRNERVWHGQVEALDGAYTMNP